MDRWHGLSQEFAGLGYQYTAEQVSDPEWCARELARKGYSLSLTMVTAEWMREKVRDVATPELLPSWTYQLWSQHHSERDNQHNNYAMRTLAESAATALFNVCRLEVDKRR